MPSCFCCSAARQVTWSLALAQQEAAGHADTPWHILDCDVLQRYNLVGVPFVIEAALSWHPDAPWVVIVMCSSMHYFLRLVLGPYPAAAAAATPALGTCISPWPWLPANPPVCPPLIHFR